MADANTIQDAIHNQWVAGFIAVAVLVIIPLVKDFWKDRRERRSDELSQVYLKSIADSNNRLADQQMQLNVLLQTSIGVGNARHEQNLDAMRHICRFGVHFKPSGPEMAGLAIVGQKLPKPETQPTKKGQQT